VNGESVEAETAEALYERIIAEIREIELIDD
jgi:uncharacterized protein YuzB (UPF0349 family)